MADYNEYYSSYTGERIDELLGHVEDNERWLNIDDYKTRSNNTYLTSSFTEENENNLRALISSLTGVGYALYTENGPVVSFSTIPKFINSAGILEENNIVFSYDGHTYVRSGDGRVDVSTYQRETDHIIYGMDQNTDRVNNLFRSLNHDDWINTEEGNFSIKSVITRGSQGLQISVPSESTVDTSYVLFSIDDFPGVSVQSPDEKYTGPFYMDFRGPSPNSYAYENTNDLTLRPIFDEDVYDVEYFIKGDIVDGHELSHTSIKFTLKENISDDANTDICLKVISNTDALCTVYPFIIPYADGMEYKNIGYTPAFPTLNELHKKTRESTYVLPAATDTTLGGMIIGDGLEGDNGTVSTDLTPYIVIDNTDYKYKVQLKNSNGDVLSESNEMDLPIESVVVDAEYDNTTKKLILTLQNGNTLEVPLSSLIGGLVPDSRKIASLNLQNDISKSDLRTALNVEDGANKTTVDSSLSSSSTNPVQNKVIKSVLDAKGTYSKPSRGIPKTDLAQDVKTSLDLADSALQSFTETDPTVPSHVKGITQQDINRWNASVKDYQDHAVGVEIDYDANTATRLGLAFGRTQGLMFNSLYPFGQMKRCNLANNGTVNAYYGENGYIEDGSNGQVMVEIPKFYYHVEPVKYSKITDGQGYHIKKARYWVSEEQLPNFKIHPAFIGEDGNICNKIYIAAYEGCLYDVSAGAYLAHDEQVLDATADLLSSIAGVKPASGLTQQLTRSNLESAAKRRGSNWHINGIKSASLVQLLMLIELAGNFQTVLGNSVVSITDQSAYSCTSLTGSTSSLGNDSGMASQTINEINGVQTTYTNNGRVSVSYRGIENPYGNIWDFAGGVNIHGNGSQKGGILYIAKDFDWAESKNNGNYESAGFTLANTSGYTKYFGYGTEDFDWLFMPSEVGGSSSGIIGDNINITSNLDGYKTSLVGSAWSNTADAGGFGWRLDYNVGGRYRSFGGRLYYVGS